MRGAEGKSAQFVPISVEVQVLYDFSPPIGSCHQIEEGTKTQPVTRANGLSFPRLQLQSTAGEHSAVKSRLAFTRRLRGLPPLQGGGSAAPQPQETRRQRVQEQAPIET